MVLLFCLKCCRDFEEQDIQEEKRFWRDGICIAELGEDRVEYAGLHMGLSIL